MSLERVVELLTDTFGREKVVIRSEYHVQAFAGVNRPHNVWIGREGLKWRLFGCRDTQSGSYERLQRDLERYDVTSSDLHRLQEMRSIGRDVEDAARVMARLGLTKGVFCDAGFKDGRAKIAVIKVNGDSVDVHVEPVDATSPAQAETVAIVWALNNCPGYIVYSDCAEAVRSFDAPLDVVWIDRSSNRSADELANLRGT